MSESDNEFVAALLYPEGWTVLSPWIETVEGHRYRQHIAPQTGATNRMHPEAKHVAEHLAAQLNAILSPPDSETES